MLDIIIFDVEHGQSIFFYPQNAPAYGMLVDCGNTQDFNPIDQLIAWNLLPKHASGGHILGNLAITNYDHDHYSGLPYLRSKAHISTAYLANNISSRELLASKPVRTTALEHICFLKDTYTSSTQNYAPPYVIALFSLSRNCFPAGQCDTNNLSQVIFVQYLGSTICICGDLEKVGWEQMLLNENFKSWLAVTNVFVAAHHGRENGHAEEAFGYCQPECIILSDKTIVHGTQEGMSQAYGARVVGNGISLANLPFSQPRKVLTTRNDGHIWIQFAQNAGRVYRSL